MSGRLTPASLEAVKERADIVELVRPDTDLLDATGGIRYPIDD